MFFKIVFAVVVCFALTSALPIPGDIGESLPDPFEDVIMELFDLIKCLKAQLPQHLTTPQGPSSTAPSTTIEYTTVSTTPFPI